MINSMSTESQSSVLCLMTRKVSFHLKTNHLTKKAKVSINIADYFQHIREVLAKMSHIA